MHQVIRRLVGLSLCVFVIDEQVGLATWRAFYIYIYTYIFFFKGLLAFWLTLCTCVHVCVAILARTWLIPFGLTLVLVLLFFVFLCFGFGPGASEIVRRLQLLAKYFFFLHEIFYLSNPKTKKKIREKIEETKRNEKMPGQEQQQGN